MRGISLPTANSCFRFGGRKAGQGPKQLDVMLREDILNPELPVEVIRHRCDSVVEALLPYLQESDHKRL